VTSFDGTYYTIREAILLPRPLQQPRPPITIAASGPRMRKLAARWGDTWNTVRSLYPLSQETLRLLDDRNRSITEFCEAFGRDPASLRRSVLHFHPEPGMEFPFNSADECGEILEKIIEIGFNEIILQYPYNEHQLTLFEQVATDILPSLK
jgi:hypothetical protein